jgi:hypothetical protein
LQSGKGGILGYVRQVEFQWEVDGGVTLFVWLRGLRYQRTVGRRGFLTLHETAAILNKDFSTIFRWAQDGRIRVVRMRRVVMVPVAEVRRLRPVARGRNWEPA